ncbi:copper amine oxidase N-terminal domain-containing protein [Paenibacillus sp. SI8]|uniref:copper amine oxidase N-terminal domain-containing protein n=1 Tax=unclassified Paenibacillus TaxID=185978 RepID=UPI003466684F
MRRKSNKRRLILCIGAICQLALGTVIIPQQARSAEPSQLIQLQLDNSAASVNGRKVELPAPPRLMNNVTMVPLRFVSEALGSDLSWDDVTRTITLSIPSKRIQLTIEQNEALIDGTRVPLDTPASIINDTTMVPLRFIAEQFGQQATFDPQTRSITITPLLKKESPDPLPKPVEKKRLERPIVKNLTTDITLGKGKVLFTGAQSSWEILSIVIDKNHRVYYLDYDKYFDYGGKFGTFSIKMYDPKVGKTVSTLYYNQYRFKFTYEDHAHQTQTFNSEDVYPVKLFYNEATDQVYLFGDSLNPHVKGILIYEILPEVHHVSLQETDMNFRLNQNFMSTTDGKKFYYSDVYHHKLYSIDNGVSMPKLSDATVLKRDSNLISLVKDGQTYLLDSWANAIYTIREDKFQKVAELKTSNIISAVSANGYFYLCDGSNIYRVTPEGKIENYINFESLSYHKGQYDPVTQTYDEEVYNTKSNPYNELRPIFVNMSTRFAVDSDGNVVMYDGNILRQIQVYP